MSSNKQCECRDRCERRGENWFAPYVPACIDPEAPTCKAVDMIHADELPIDSLMWAIVNSNATRSISRLDYNRIVVCVQDWKTRYLDRLLGEPLTDYTIAMAKSSCDNLARNLSMLGWTAKPVRPVVFKSSIYPGFIDICWRVAE